MSEPLVPSGFFALRTPLLPFGELLGWAEGAVQDREVLRARLREIVARPEVREAIFVSSPSLEALIDAWAADPDTPRNAECERALVRFVARMCGRPTPFGLFAGVSTGIVGAKTSLVLDGREAYRRHTRLDASFLVDVVERHEPSTYVPNPSLYRSADRRRYVRSRPGADERRHLLVSVRDSHALAACLAAADRGATTAAITEALAESGVDIERAGRYVDDLVEQQVLVPTVDLQMTGADAVYGLGDAVPALAQAGSDLAALDEESLGIRPERYRAIAATLEGLTEEPQLDRLFQVDMRKSSTRATLGEEVVREILRALELRRRIAPANEDSALRRFVERYMRRFEGREVPLLEALDPDLGVSFDDDDAGAAPLLDGLRAAEPTTQAERFGSREEHLLFRLVELQADGRRELVLDASDVARLENPAAEPLPEAAAAIAVVAARSEEALAGGRFRVLVYGADGPSGARLLGRFCHADPVLRAAVEEHLRAEEALDPEAVFAEVVHLPRARDVNVVARPVLREWEIACLGQPGAPPERQLPLDDLLVSIHRGRVVLRSQQLGRRVVPRMTTAHNFHQRGVSAYRLLCRLQEQGLSNGAGFWGPLASVPWLPRVRSGRIVLERERWRLTADELDGADGKDAAVAAVQDWRRRLGVPRFVSHVSPAVELTVDLDNVLAVDGLVQALRAHGTARLAEQFPPPEELCVHGPEGAFVHELVVPFVRSRAPVRSRERISEARIRRTFPPGSDWLYARISTGATIADRILADEIAGLVRDLLGSGAADRWFFLRFADPDFHLRIRFHGDPARLHAEALPALEASGASALERGLAWRIELGTYEREVERYGGPEAIELAERAFHADSDAVLAILPLLEPGDAGQEERWRLGLCGAHRLLVDLGLDLAERLELTRGQAEAIAGDRGWTKEARARVGERFRKERATLERLLDPDPAAPTGLEHGLEILAGRSRALEPIGLELGRLESDGRLAASRPAIASSLLHMHLNRLLRGDNTAQEAMICDFLARLYEAETRRAAQSSG